MSPFLKGVSRSDGGFFLPFVTNNPLWPSAISPYQGRKQPHPKQFFSQKGAFCSLIGELPRKIAGVRGCRYQGDLTHLIFLPDKGGIGWVCLHFQTPPAFGHLPLTGEKNHFDVFIPSTTNNPLPASRYSPYQGRKPIWGIAPLGELDCGAGLRGLWDKKATNKFILIHLKTYRQSL